MKQETERNIKWMYRIALVVSLASTLWLIYYSLAHSEAPFSWFAVPAMLLFVTPLLACVVISWKWPLAGGILFILIGFLWPVDSLIIGFPGLTLIRIVKTYLPITLPFFVSGVLFLLLRRGYRISQDKDQRIPRLRLAGLFMVVFAGIFSFAHEIISRLHMPDSLISVLVTALLISIGLFLLAVASWIRPRWGGILGVAYAILMLAFFFITQAGDRTVLQMLSDLRYNFITTILVLIGSIMVLLSLTWRSRVKEIV
jgi:hypothetical protein